jgi:hypothetical protein
MGIKTPGPRIGMSGVVPRPYLRQTPIARTAAPKAIRAPGVHVGGAMRAPRMRGPRA